MWQRPPFENGSVRGCYSHDGGIISLSKNTSNRKFPSKWRHLFWNVWRSFAHAVKCDQALMLLNSSSFFLCSFLKTNTKNWAVNVVLAWTITLLYFLVSLRHPRLLFSLFNFDYPCFLYIYICLSINLYIYSRYMNIYQNVYSVRSFVV